MFSYEYLQSGVLFRGDRGLFWLDRGHRRVSDHWSGLALGFGFGGTCRFRIHRVYAGDGHGRFGSSRGLELLVSSDRDPSIRAVCLSVKQLSYFCCGFELACGLVAVSAVGFPVVREPDWECSHFDIDKLPTEHVNEKAPAAPSLAAVVSENARGMSAPQTNGGAPPSFAAVVRGNDSTTGSSYAASVLSGNSVPAPVILDNQNVPIRKAKVHSRGEKPWKHDDLFLKLQSIWKLSKWKLIHLGRGYFHVLLHSEEDRKKVWSQGTLNLKPGFVRLQAWILFDLARGIGVPLRIAEATLNGNFGYFARILVDVDLAGHPVGRCRMIQRRVPPMAKPSEKGKNDSKAPTQIQKPKLPPPLDTSQGQSSGLHAENPHQPPLSTRLNVSDNQVPTSVTVVTGIVAMDSEEEHSVPENIKGTGAQDMPPDLGDTFDDLNEELPP
ncbi:hypothetical protein FNV43_RR05785 [Rhamnella rubrinervis]|uniref:DUF4283 domain-containing protein n=1 Tax=Rhamnella rubrinervis TaxID=2594499 RepID=A0A8K0HM74_9ROSA|nr:hypothetical protein FNV43_RR05785 [Rhamnella rubrinervis]